MYSLLGFTYFVHKSLRSKPAVCHAEYFTKLQLKSLTVRAVNTPMQLVLKINIEEGLIKYIYNTNVLQSQSCGVPRAHNSRLYTMCHDVSAVPWNVCPKH